MGVDLMFAGLYAADAISVFLPCSWPGVMLCVRCFFVVLCAARACVSLFVLCVWFAVTCCYVAAVEPVERRAETLRRHSVIDRTITVVAIAEAQMPR